ncbi:hypothetical protein FRC07_005117 [Ceratobasidium sp. 392]|nr:hypothetical protein FRC07_005117 [Ceratobasidium sp. 392]
MAFPARFSTFSISTRLAVYPHRAQRLAPRLVSRYSSPAQIPPSPPPSASSDPKAPKELVTPPEPPIEYSRKPREISSLSKNPWVVRAVKLIAPFMGYYSRTTTAIRETRAMYSLCGERLEKEQDFLYKGSDATLAGMVWRNLFASRGALPVTPELDNAGKRKLVIASAEDAALPPVLHQFVGYVRRELARLEAIPDKEVADGRIGEWGTVSSVHVPTGESDFAAWQATGSTIKGGQKQAATA